MRIEDWMSEKELLNLVGSYFCAKYRLTRLSGNVVFRAVPGKTPEFGFEFDRESSERIFSQRQGLVLNVSAEEANHIIAKSVSDIDGDYTVVPVYDEGRPSGFDVIFEGETEKRWREAKRVDGGRFGGTIES